VSRETADTDGDGVGDHADAFPNDPTETADSDGDGVGFPNDPTETVDTDGDGVGDNADASPAIRASGPTVTVTGSETTPMPSPTTARRPWTRMAMASGTTGTGRMTTTA
jgi:hypothetical protein